RGSVRGDARLENLDLDRCGDRRVENLPVHREGHGRLRGNLPVRRAFRVVRPSTEGVAGCVPDRVDVEKLMEGARVVGARFFQLELVSLNGVPAIVDAHGPRVLDTAWRLEALMHE